jgi:hypothetical protein
MASFSARLQRRDTLLRGLLLIVALLVGLVLANAAASLFAVWQLDPGSPVPAPWNNLFDAARATDKTDMLALLGTALFAGAGLACLVFFLERVIKTTWRWLRNLLGS